MPAGRSGGSGRPSSLHVTEETDEPPCGAAASGLRSDRRRRPPEGRAGPVSPPTRRDAERKSVRAQHRRARARSRPGMIDRCGVQRPGTGEHDAKTPPFSPYGGLVRSRSPRRNRPRSRLPRQGLSVSRRSGAKPAGPIEPSRHRPSTCRARRYEGSSGRSSGPPRPPITRRWQEDCPLRTLRLVLRPLRPGRVAERRNDRRTGHGPRCPAPGGYRRGNGSGSCKSSDLQSFGSVSIRTDFSSKAEKPSNSFKRSS